MKKAHGARKPDGRGAHMYKAQYPLIKQSNQARKHFILGFVEHMNTTLKTKIKLTKFQPHILMSEAEKQQRPFEDPYWVFLSGGKKDYPTKIWAQSYWQQVIDATRDRVNWVQCGGGSANHIMHGPKRGIYANMVAKTDCRNFLRLIYHSEGVVCVTTMAMHAAAAFNKPCVVIEGGREPWWWEAYNEEARSLSMKCFDPGWSPPADDDFVPHRFLHTIGKLACCKNHGCWRKRVVGGGSVCTNAVTIAGQTIPKCKSMITPDMVVAAIDGYLDDGLARRPESVKDIKVPFIDMRTPDTEQTPAVQAPAPPPVKQPDLPPADLSNLRFCVYGSKTPPMAGPHVSSFHDDTDRREALRVALACPEEWIVWIGGALEFHPDWLNKLVGMLKEPGIVGRAYRTEGGLLYPYPSFFAAHRNLVGLAETFDASFKAQPEQFQRVGDLVKLPT